MGTTFRGTFAALLQEAERDFDPQRGFVYTYRYRGADQATMDAAQQTYIDAGIACRVVHNQGDSATLYISDSTQSFTIDNWEIIGNEESRDLWSHPNLINTLNAHGYDAEEIIATARLNFSDTTGPDELFGFGGDLEATTLDAPIVERFYRMKMRGAEDYRHGQYVLRHKTNVSNRWNVNIADVAVDQNYTTAQLLTEVTNPALWVFPLPPRLQYKISNITPPPSQAFYQWGWLKSSSTETTGAHNRVDIITEYTLEQWPTDVYAPY
jgi:hypothetical protein